MATGLTTDETIPKSIVGIVGSPRRGKNTGTLVEKVLEGAASQGAVPTLFYLGDYQIGGCRACEACKRTRRCTQQDDMQMLYAALDQARGLVIGTPIYLDHITAQLKTFLDRLYAYLGPNLEHYFPDRVKAVLVATWGDSKPHAYDDVVGWLERRLRGYFAVETVAVVTAPDMDSTTAASRPELLRSALEAGATLAQCLE